MNSSNLSEEQRGEIRTAYRQAKHKAAQVKILSELYGISTGEVCAVIGIDDPCKKKTYSPQEKAAAVRAVTEEGLSLKEVCNKFGISWPSLKKWCADAEKETKEDPTTMTENETLEISPKQEDPHKNSISYGSLFLDPDMCGDVADFIEHTVIRAMKVDDAFESIEYLRNILNAASVLRESATSGNGLYPLSTLKTFAK